MSSTQSKHFFSNEDDVKELIDMFAGKVSLIIDSAGEKELEEAEERRRSGIPLHEGIVSNLKLLAEETNIKFDLVS